MTPDETLKLVEGDSPRSEHERLQECYLILYRIAYSKGRVGNRPLAGGIEEFVKKVLKRHGLERPEDIKRMRCPCCGQEVEHDEMPEVQGVQE